MNARVTGLSQNILQRPLTPLPPRPSQLLCQGPIVPCNIKAWPVELQPQICPGSQVIVLSVLQDLHLAMLGRTSTETLGAALHVRPAPRLPSPPPPSIFPGRWEGAKGPKRLPRRRRMRKGTAASWRNGRDRARPDHAYSPPRPPPQAQAPLSFTLPTSTPLRPLSPPPQAQPRPHPSPGFSLPGSWPIIHSHTC